MSLYDDWIAREEEKRKNSQEEQYGTSGTVNNFTANPSQQESSTQKNASLYDDWIAREEKRNLQREIERPQKEYQAKIQEFDTGLQQAKDERNFIQKIFRTPTKKEREIAGQKAEFVATTYNKRYTQEQKDAILAQKPKDVKLSDEQYISLREDIDNQLKYLNSVKAITTQAEESLNNFRQWEVKQTFYGEETIRKVPFLPTKEMIAQSNTYNTQTDWSQAQEYLKKAAKESGMSEEEYARSYNAMISGQMLDIYQKVVGDASLTKDDIIDTTRRTGIPAVTDDQIRIEIENINQYLDKAKGIYDEYTGVKEVDKVDNIKELFSKEGLEYVRDDVLSGTAPFVNMLFNQNQTGFLDTMQLEELKKKLENGGKLTNAETARLLLTEALETNQQIDRGTWTRTAEGVADNLSLIGEMAATWGIFSGTSTAVKTTATAATKKISYSAAKEIVEAAASEGGKNWVKTLFTKGAFKEGAIRIASDVATAMIAEIPETIAKDSLKIASEVMTTDSRISFSDPETEEMFLSIVKEDEGYNSDWANKLTKAFARQYFNNVLERGAGEIPEGIIDFGADKLKGLIIAKYMSQKGIQTLEEFSKVYKVAGFNGFFGEVFEEYAQDYAESIIDNRDFIIDDPDKFWDIVASVGVLRLGRAGSVATTVIDVTSNIARGITFDTQQQTDQQVPPVEGAAPVDSKIGQDLDTLVTNTQTEGAIQEDLQTKEIIRQQQVSGETQTVLAEPVDDATLLSKARTLSDISKQTDYSLSSLTELKKLEKQATDEKTAQAIATISDSYASVLARKVADGSVNIGQQIDTQLQDNIKEIRPDETLQEEIKSTKQEILETPNKQYYVQEKGKFKEIKDAQSIKIINEADTFIYKDAESKLYQVVEAKSGMAIAEASTRSAAVEQATARLNKMGLETFQSKIQEVISKKGISPRYIKKEVKKVVKKEAKTQQQPKAKETPVKLEEEAREYTKEEAGKKIEEETKGKPMGEAISENGKLYKMSDDSLVSTGKEPEKIPIKYIYRAVSDSEYESIKKTGYIKSNSNKNLSSEKGLTVYKDSNPLFYLPEEGGYVLKVEVKQENGLYYDNADGYVKTKEKIPTSQIVEVLSVGHKEQSPAEKAGLKVGSKIKVQGKLREVSDFGKSARDSQGVLVKFTDGTYITLDKAKEYAAQKQTKDAVKKESTEKTKEAVKEAEEEVKKLEKEKKVDQNRLAKRRMDIGKTNPEIKKITKDLKDFQESEDYKALKDEYKILQNEARVTHSSLESYIDTMIDMYGEEAATYLDDFMQRWTAAQEVIQDLMDKKSELINQQLVEEGFKLRKQKSGRYVLDSKELNEMDLARMKEISKEVLGDENVEILESILTPSNMDAMGRYMANWIQIRAGSIDKGSTFYHEAVHKALDIFLTPQEKALLIKEVRKSVGDEKLIEMFGDTVANKKFRLDSYRGSEETSLDDMAEEWLAENIIPYINKKTPKTFTEKIKASVDKFIDRWFRTMDNIDTIENFYKGLLSGRLLKRQIELQKQDNGNLKQIAGVPIVYQGLVKYKEEPTVINFLKDIKALFTEAKKYKSAEEFVNETAIRHQTAEIQPIKNPNDIVLYHGTAVRNYDSLTKPPLEKSTMDRIYGDYFYATNKRAETETYGRYVAQLNIPKEKILTLDQYRQLPSPKPSDEQLFKKYWAIEAPDNEFIIKDVNKVKEYTKSQLTDIWNKANKNNADDALINEAKKYKSAEEFVDKNIDDYVKNTDEYKNWARGSKNIIEAYHGTPYSFDNFEIGKKQAGAYELDSISFATKKELAEPFSRQYPDWFYDKKKIIENKYRGIDEIKDKLKKIDRQSKIRSVDEIKKEGREILSGLKKEWEDKKDWLFNNNYEKFKGQNTYSFGRLKELEDELNRARNIDDIKITQAEKTKLRKYEKELNDLENEVSGNVYKVYIKGKNIIDEIGEEIGFGSTRNQIVADLDGDILRIKDADTGQYIGEEIIVNDPSQIFIVNSPKNKSQLTEIWNKAQETQYKYRADLLFDEEVEVEEPTKPSEPLKSLEITKTPEKGVVYDTKGTSILPSRKLQQQIEETLMSGQSTPATRSITAFIPVIETSGKIKDSRAFEKIQDRYSEIQELDPGLNELKYQSMSIADITAKAMVFVDEYPAEARRVALGMELAPEGTTNIAVSLAYTEKMFEDGKWKEARAADRALSLRGTRLGQEIVSFKGRLNANSPMFFMEQVLNARRMVVSSRMFKSGSLENFAKIKQERMAEVAKTLKQIKLEKAEDFINKLTC